jgi:signal transduction histidine kinase
MFDHDARAVGEADEFRTLFVNMVHASACAMIVLFAAGLVLDQLEALEMDEWRVGLVVAAMLLDCAVQVRLARRGVRPRTLFFVFHAVNIAAITCILHWLGGVQFPGGALLYALVVVNAGFAGLPAYLFANLGGAAYALLLALEHARVITPYAPYTLDPDIVAFLVPVRVTATFVIFTWVVLNVLALYVHRTTKLVEWSRRRVTDANAALERHRETLEREVFERTTALRAANADLDEKARALRERTERLRSFVYAVTHDLKNPVSAIVLTADRALQRNGANVRPDTRKDLERILRLAGDTQDMIHGLLALFRVTATREERAAVDLNAVAASAVADLQTEIARKRIRVQVDPLPGVRGQPHKLEQLVANLLSNAIRHVPEDTGAIHVSGRTDDGSVVLCVTDNGAGIPPAYHDAVFNVFAHVPGDDGSFGTGVGLAIVKRVAETHGGTVELESSAGAGARFTVRLPAADAAAGAGGISP